MEKIGYIYKITNHNGKIYIGQTTRLNNRISAYRTSNNIKAQQLLYNSIKKYGWENHIFEVLTEVPTDIIYETEIKYIKDYNSYHKDNPNGLNMTKGGEGTLGRKNTPETIKKRINSILGRKHTEESKKLMSELKKCKPSHKKGVPCSESTKEKISKANKGKLTSISTVTNRNYTRLKKLIEDHISILQIDKTTKEVVKEWVMLPKEIGRLLNTCDSAILKCLKHKKEHHKGFIWRYKK
jgi:group I intron endonuclease